MQQKCVKCYHVTKQSLEFTLTRLFMKVFRTASATVVIECQRNFCFLPVVLQIQIRTARFLQVFTATENSLCLLFYDNAAEQLCDMFREHNVRTANQFANAVYGEFTVVEQ